MLVFWDGLVRTLPEYRLSLLRILEIFFTFPSHGLHDLSLSSSFVNFSIVRLPIGEMKATTAAEKDRGGVGLMLDRRL